MSKERERGRARWWCRTVSKQHQTLAALCAQRWFSQALLLQLLLHHGAPRLGVRRDVLASLSSSCSDCCLAGSHLLSSFRAVQEAGRW